MARNNKSSAAIQWAELLPQGRQDVSVIPSAFLLTVARRLRARQECGRVGIAWAIERNERGPQLQRT
jgi:hypothetical protein